MVVERLNSYNQNNRGLVGARFLQGADFTNECLRRGKCPKCGITQVGKRNRGIGGLRAKFQDIEEIRDDEGNLLVYKGFCLGPACYSLKEAKTRLGEIEASRTPRFLTTDRPSTRNGNETSSQLLDASGNSSGGDHSSRSRRGSAEMVPPNPSTFRHPSPLPADAPLSPALRSPQSTLRHFVSPEVNGPPSSRRTSRRRSSNNPNAGSNNDRPFVDGMLDESTGSRASVGMHGMHLPNAPNLFEDPPFIIEGLSYEESEAVRELRNETQHQDMANFTKFMAILGNNASRKPVVKVALQELCQCVCVAHLKKKEPYSLFATDGWVKSFKDDIIPKYSEDEEVLALVAETFAVMSYTLRTYLLDLTHVGGVTILLEAMEKHRGNTHLIDSCCFALFCLVDTEVHTSKTPPHSKSMGLTLQHSQGRKTVESLLLSLDTASTFGKRCAMDALVNLALQHIPDNDGKLLVDVVRNTAHGCGSTLIIEAVKTDATHVGLTESALTLLSILKPCAAALHDLTPAILVTILTLEDTELLTSAFDILRVVSNDPDSTLSSSSLPQLLKAVSSSMEKHIDNELLCQAAVNVLVAILARKEARVLVEEEEWEKLLSVTIQLMREFATNASLQVSCIAFLATSVMTSDACKITITSNGGVNAVTMALTKHLFHGDLEEDLAADLRLCACTVLASLATCSVTAPTLCTEDCVTTYSKAVQGATSALPQPIRRNLLHLLGLIAARDGNGCHLPFASRMVEAAMKAESREEAQAMLTELAMLCSVSPNMIVPILCAQSGTGLSRIVELMNCHSTSRPVQEAGCDILGYVYTKFKFKGNMAQTSSVELGSSSFTVKTHKEEEMLALRTAYSNFRSNASIVVKAATALYCFNSGLYHYPNLEAVQTDARLQSALQGLFQNCLESMARFPRDVDVQNSSLRLIRSLMLVDPSNVHRHFDQLLQRMLSLIPCLQQGNKELNSNFCGTLLILVDEESEDQKLTVLGSSSFVRPFFHLLESGCETIVSDVSELVARLLPRLMMMVNSIMNEPDAIENIVACIFQYGNTPRVVGNCCLIMTSLATLHYPHATTMIAECGGIAAILEVLQNHPNDEFVQESACKTLLSVSRGIPRERFPEMKEQLCQSIVDTLRLNEHNPRILVSMIELIWCLCSRDDIFKGPLTAGGIIPIVVSGMQSFLPDRDLQAAGCATLWCLSNHQNNRASIGAVNGPAAIINALLMHIDTYRIQKEGLTCLKNLATTSFLKRRISIQGGEEAILFSLWVNYQDEEIVSSAFSALNNIAVDVEARTVACVEASVFDCIIGAMKRFCNSVNVQKNACFLLKSYSFAPSNMDLMRQRGHDLMRRLTYAANQFPHDCRERAHYIIGLLGGE